MLIRKGDVFVANLDPAYGHEQKGKRPVLVVSNDVANDLLPVVMVAPLTGNTRAARFPSTVLIVRGEAGLTSNSVALLFQIRTVDKRRLEKRMGRVKGTTVKKLNNGLRLSFGI